MDNSVSKKAPRNVRSATGRTKLLKPKTELGSDEVRAEALRRAAFIRGMGGSLVGYGDGYADGFEHAIQWLLGDATDPLTLDYRPDAGMEFTKRYYACRPKERKRVLESFRKTSAFAKANGGAK